MMKINQTFKNLKRLQQIGLVFGRHGFRSVFEEMGLDRIIPFQKVDDNSKPHSPAVRLRMAFEELGTTFVKLGQMLSIRPDLIPREFIEEFRKLQDQVVAFPFEQARLQIIKELEVDPETIFDDINPTPIGAASIAQVHRAKLKDGKEVVVKVRRPGIERQIETDLSILYTVANLLDRYVAALAIINPVDLANEFGRVIRDELNFTQEAQNIEQFQRNFADDPQVVIPEVIWEHTGQRVLTMTFLDGFPLNAIRKQDLTETEIKAIAHLGAQTFLKMVFIDGYFHGDIHGGNIMVVDRNKIGLIDFGLVGRLDQRLMEDIAGLFLSLVMRDFRAVSRQYLRLATSTRDVVSPDLLAADLRQLLEPLMGLALKDINSAELLMDLAAVAQRHRLQVPQNLLLLARAIAALEGIGRELDPEFNVIDISSDFARTIVVERYKPERLAADLIQVLRDITDLSRDMPSQLQSILRRAEQGGLAVDVRVPDMDLLADMRRNNWRMVLAILAAGGLITVGLASTTQGLPLSGWLGGMLFLGSSAALVFDTLRGKKRR